MSDKSNDPGTAPIAVSVPRERTSADIAKIAGQLLGGKSYAAALDWLQTFADSPETPADVREHAVTLLGVLASMRRLAGSALTQR